MGEVSIEHLFTHKRLPSGPNLILLLLYLPIGLCLAIVRFFIGLHVYAIASVLPKTSFLRRLVMRSMCTVLGIVVVQENSQNYDEQCKIVVANYTTKFDYVPIQLVAPHHVVSIWNFSDLVTRLLGYIDLGAQFGRETLISNAKQLSESSNIPLLSFPEGTTTNGRAGLLKFSVWPFSLDKAVQPIAITISRPLFSVSPVRSLANSHLCVDWFWLFFVPCTIFHISYLPVQLMADDEEASEFGKKVQKLISDKMTIEATNYTCNDKLELLKRQAQANKIPDQRSKGQNPSQQMLEQVKNVLPHVPDSVIVRDLAMTKDIDLTISNILEGRAEVDRGERGHEKTPPTNLNIQSQSKMEGAYKSSSFGKTSKERQLSFQDRKTLMIEEAKEKYLKKFGKMD